LHHALNLTSLKAVLLVGPIDGNDGSWTLQEIANMERAAAVLEAHGVIVYRFYPGTGTFADIEQAAKGAHFLLYRGHGVYDGNLPHPNVGGFALSSGYYSPDRIRQSLHLASNAVVMLYGCFTAGSSSATGDEYDIGIMEASRRVAQYSDPFFDRGAAGYYANWFGNAFEQFLINLFAGQTLGQAYENYFDFSSNTVYRTAHPEHPEMSMWVDKDNWEYWQYNNAFVGRFDWTLQDLFKPVTLGGIPSSLAFTVDVSDTISIQPTTHTVTPINIDSQVPITWSLHTSGNWFSVSPIQGDTTKSFAITPTIFDTSRPGRYTGVITATAISPPETQNPVQSIALSLEVLVPELGGLPTAVSFSYSISDDAFLTDVYTLTPENKGSAAALEWEVATDSPWLHIAPQSGQTPQSLALTAAEFDTTTVALYSGLLTVTATAPASVYHSPQVLPVSLHVIDRPFGHVYLSLIRR
jgi:hypothetical protein